MHLIAHDLGTSGDKAVLYRTDGALVASVTERYPTRHPADGFVEQEPEDWWRAVAVATGDLLEKAGVPAGDIAAVSFSGQMMGCVLLDAVAAPIRPAIIWADTRASDQERAMAAALGDDVPAGRGYRVTGHRLSASYSAAKLLWVKDNDPGAYARAAHMVNAKDFVVARLTGVVATDYSDGSSTNLLDIRARAWSEDLVAAFGIRRSLLPDLLPSASVVGSVTPAAAAATGLVAGTPVVLGGGDGSCACVGAGVTAEGSAYLSLGTSAWISFASKAPAFDPLARTFTWAHLDPALLTPCGAMQAAGFSRAWLEGLLSDAAASPAAPGSLSADADSLLFLPYLLGERSPWWDLDARGAIIGLGAATSAADLRQAVLAGVGHNLRVILDLLDPPTGPITVVGGGARNRAWLQTLSDVLDRELAVPGRVEEAASRGAAIAGGVAIGAFPDYSVAATLLGTVDIVRPNPGRRDAVSKTHEVFTMAYDRLRPVYAALADLRDEAGR